MIEVGANFVFDKKDRMFIGGNSITYKGHNLLTNQSVLIKALYDTSNETYILEKLYEDRVTSRYVVKYYGTFGSYIVLEYIEGIQLDQFTISNTETLWTIMYQLLLGLQFIHSKGCTHNDIYGYNIMITPTPTLTCKYIDFSRGSIEDRDYMRDIYDLYDLFISLSSIDDRTQIFLDQMLSKNNINDILKLFTKVILRLYAQSIERQFKPVSKTAAIEYIMFTIINRKNFTPESLRDMYLERNITLKGTFYYDILQLGNLYDQILKIYSNPLKVTEFDNATKKSLSRNEKQQFIGFPSVFKDFYTLYGALINELIST